MPAHARRRRDSRGPAAQARPEAVVRLLDCLGPAAIPAGSGAVADGTRVLEERRRTPRRRRVEVAGLPSGTGGRGRRRPRDGGRRRAGPIGGRRRLSASARPTPAASPHGPLSVGRRSRHCAPPSAIPMLDDQTVARLGDSAVGDAKVRRPGLNEVASVSLRELVAAASAAADAARAMADRRRAATHGRTSTTSSPRPRQQRRRRTCRGRRSRHSPRPRRFRCSDDQTVARLGDSAVGDAESPQAEPDYADLSAAVEAARELTAKDVRGGYHRRSTG